MHGIGIDSLSLIELKSSVEDAFGVQLGEDEFV
jgi:acyl carrier protein